MTMTLEVDSTLFENFHPVDYLKIPINDPKAKQFASLIDKIWQYCNPSKKCLRGKRYKEEYYSSCRVIIKHFIPSRMFDEKICGYYDIGTNSQQQHKNLFSVFSTVYLLFGFHVSQN